MSNIFPKKKPPPSIGRRHLTHRLT